MSIVRCPSCAQRISSLAQECPNCGYSKNSTQIDPETLRIRQLRRSRYQARMLTYLGMLISMVGFLVWWFQNSGFDQLPGVVSRLLIGVGLVGYLAARGWLFYINRQIKK